MSSVIFEVRDVCFSYLGKYPALRGVDITIMRGERIAIMGANGSGKSTLLHLLDGLIFPDRGSIKAFGKELSEDALVDHEFSRCFRKKVGFVFQNPDVQLFCPTVKEDIMFGPLQLGTEREEAKRCLDEVAGILDIAHLLDRSPHQLSIGEKRKVALASTLVIKPEVIILDEPTAGLDPLSTRHIIDLLVQENLSGKAIITATHDLHIVEEISDTVYVLSPEKRIARSGPAREVLSDTLLLEKNNLIHVHAHRHKDVVHAHPHQHVDHHH